MRIEVMRVREVCEVLDIHEQTVYQFIKEKVPPFDRAFKVGCSWRLPRESVEALVRPITDSERIAEGRSP